MKNEMNEKTFQDRENEVRKKGVYFHTFSAKRGSLSREEANQLIDKSMNTLVGRDEVLSPEEAEKAFLEMFAQ